MTADNAIHVERNLAHPPAAVWRALTEPALHARWWAAGDVKPTLGHRFELDMGAFGKQRCEVLAVEAERLLSYRFGIGALDTVITWRLRPEGKGTWLSLTHEGFQLGTPMGKSALQGMGAGWPAVLGRLEAALSA